MNRTLRQATKIISDDLLRHTFFPPGIHYCDEPATKTIALRPILRPFDQQQ